MKETTIRDESLSKQVSQLVGETTDYAICAKYAEQYYNKIVPSCNEVIRTRLFSLCFDGGIILSERARLFCDVIVKPKDTSLTGVVFGNIVNKEDSLVCYFNGVFNNFDNDSVTAYNSMNGNEKRTYLIAATKSYYEKHDSYYRACSDYLHLSSFYPELKEQMAEKMYSLCFDSKKGLDSNYASDFIETMGKKNPYSRSLLNKYLKHCLGSFVLYTFLSALGGLLLYVVVRKLEAEWAVWIKLLVIPLSFGLVLGGGLQAIQYFLKSFTALFNYTKKRNFKFSTGTLVYQKVKGTAGGYYKNVESPIIKD